MKYLCLITGVLLAQTLPAWRWQDIETHIRQHPETLYVLNFWSTWCRPCIAELPHFQKADAALRDSLPVRFWLISLDFPPDGAQKAAALLRSRGITLPALWLDEKDPNAWIPRLTPDWDGALPYTHAGPLGHPKAFSSPQEVIDFVLKAYAKTTRDSR